MGMIRLHVMRALHEFVQCFVRRYVRCVRRAFGNTCVVVVASRYASAALAITAISIVRTAVLNGLDVHHYAGPGRVTSARAGGHTNMPRVSRRGGGDTRKRLAG